MTDSTPAQAPFQFLVDFLTSVSDEVFLSFSCKLQSYHEESSLMAFPGKEEYGT